MISGGGWFVAGAGWPEVDGERQDPVLQGPLGVADHGEVHVVGLGLVYEELALRALERGHTPLAHGTGTFLEPVEHRLDVEGVGHGDMLRARPAQPAVPRVGGSGGKLQAVHVPKGREQL